MFTQYCAPCHGVDGAGNGPAASPVTQPTNLTQLGKKHDGKYPANTVAGVLGSEAAAPIQGMGQRRSLLQTLDKYPRFHGATAHQQYRDVHRDTSSEATLARGLAGSGRQEEELFLSAVSFCGRASGAQVMGLRVKSRWQLMIMGENPNEAK
jgi:hypothetical protein